MSHAPHFLSRLSRLDVAHSDFALSLYRDAALTRAILLAAELPEGPSRVALALAPGERSPHLVVERDGSFVTCLAAGMQVHDALLLDHARLERLRTEMSSLRAALERAEAVAGPDSGLVSIVQSLYTEGDRLPRERMLEAITVAPLWDVVLPSITGEIVRDVQRSGSRLRAQKGLPRWARTTEGEALLRAHWLGWWALAHLAVVFAAGGAHRPSLDEAEALLLERLFAWLCFSGSAALMIHGGWAVAHRPQQSLEPLVHRWDGAEGTIDVLGAAFGLSVAAARSEACRERVLALFRQASAAPGDAAVGPDSIEGSRAMLGEIFLNPLVDPAAAERILVATGRDLVWRLSRTRGKPSWASSGHVPEALARTAISFMEGDPLVDRASLAAVVTCVPWLGRARPEELYLPAAEVARLEDPWTVAEGLRFLENELRWYPKSMPLVHAERAPGRNEPCKCGSGKKYKRCCAGG